MSDQRDPEAIVCAGVSRLRDADPIPRLVFGALTRTCSFLSIRIITPATGSITRRGVQMPSCMLRVSGSTAKVRKFLAESSLQPVRVFWKGQPGVIQSRGPIQTSGFNITLSRAEGLPVQARQAVRFMRKHRDDMLLIRSLGFSSVTLDFGLYDLATEDRPWPSYRRPTTLVQLAAELGCNIDLSFYGAAPHES